MAAWANNHGNMGQNTWFEVALKHGGDSKYHRQSANMAQHQLNLANILAGPSMNPKHKTVSRLHHYDVEPKYNREP